MSVFWPATILGGLPVIAEVAFGKDADGPWGWGEYWAEVEGLYWQKRDGSKGARLPATLYDRAEKYDPGFCDLTTNVSDDMAAEQSEQERLVSGAPAMVSFT